MSLFILNFHLFAEFRYENALYMLVFVTHFFLSIFSSAPIFSSLICFQFNAIILLRIFACISGSLIQAQAKNPNKFICCQNIYFALVSLFQFAHWVMTILRDFLVYQVSRKYPDWRYFKWFYCCAEFSFLSPFRVHILRRYSIPLRIDK